MSNVLNIEQSLLQTLVPVNALTEDHLNTLLRDSSMEIVCSGHEIFSIGDSDGKKVYLLSGQALIQDEHGDNKILNADNPVCQFPVLQCQPRKHKFSAVSDCLIIRFDTDRLDEMLAWDQASTYIMLAISEQRDLDEDAQWMMTLLKSDFFYKVSPMNIREVIKRFEAVYYAAGETIIRQGEMADACYFIKEGLVSVQQAVDDKYPAKIVNELGPGKCFGEDALVYDAPRNATITMKTSGVLMKLHKRDFYRLLKHPTAASISAIQFSSNEHDGAMLIDVRTEDEFDQGHYPGAVNMPLDLLKLKSRMLDQSKPCILYCDTGRRSMVAATLLGEDGFNARMLEGGILGGNVAQQQKFCFVDGENSLTGAA